MRAAALWIRVGDGIHEATRRMGVCFARIGVASLVACFIGLDAFADSVSDLEIARDEQGREYVADELIVKLKGSSKTLKSQAYVGKAVSESGMSLKGSWSGLNMHQFKLRRGDSLKAALSEARRNPDVEFAEPNYILTIPESSDAVEQVVGFASALDAAASSTVQAASLAQTSAPINVVESWTIASPSSAVTPVVAVVDTGVDFEHTFFVQSGAIWSNVDEIPDNGVDDDGNGFIDDVRGWNFAYNNNWPMDDDNHGTHVAGIVMGVTQDMLNSPVQPARIRIMPLKFLNSNGSGTTSDAVKAIYYAVNNGAKVINNSWGGGGYSQSLLDALTYAYNQKVVIVSAAGNAASNNDALPIYPASYPIPGMISVASTTDSDLLSGFSNYGLNSVHVGAPGSSIWSTLPNNQYGRSSGTSMAAPFVAGLAAQMLRENSDLTAYQVKELIFSSGQVLASLQNRTVSQKRINVLGAVDFSKSAVAASSQPGFSSPSRAPAAEMDGAAGCGLVKSMADLHREVGGDSDGSGSASPIAIGAMLVMLIAPLLVALGLRARSTQNGDPRRRYPRYEISTGVRLQVGGRELIGEVSSISMGGVQLSTDAWLENGGVVTMSIKSPDGKEEIQVGGKIVWSEEKKRYGVAFDGADSRVANSIARWTSGLLGKAG